MIHFVLKLDELSKCSTIDLVIREKWADFKNIDDMRSKFVDALQRVKKQSTVSFV